MLITDFEFPQCFSIFFISFEFKTCEDIYVYLPAYQFLGNS
jgi:hypothetical protein